MKYISKSNKNSATKKPTLRKLKKPKGISVQLHNGKGKTYLVGEQASGEPINLPISRAVAEVLVANGFTYQG